MTFSRRCGRLIRTLAPTARRRRRHRRGLALVGRLDRRLGAIVVDHGEPAAWCLPGAGRLVVLTSAAIEALDAAQLAAVLAHERAHQRGRHHLLVSLTGALAAAFFNAVLILIHHSLQSAHLALDPPQPFEVILLPPE